MSSIAERQCISPRYREQVFQNLKKGGLIRSTRGLSGGYYLAKKPGEISVGDVIRAVEGDDTRLVFCSGERRGREGRARYGKWSPTRGTRLQNTDGYFDSVTLETICADAKEKGFGISGPSGEDLLA